jgi:poly(A) polymerase
MTEREFAIDVVRRLQEAGHEALWAGGCVRDELLGLEPKDYDVATDARPERVQSLFRRAVAVGASFGVIEVLGPRSSDRGGQHLSVEVATFRTDGTYSDGRRPDQVVFASAREDALRRDFTINGMFFNPLKGELIDLVGGRADLHAHILRAIGNAGQRFEEDKLRLLRAVRLATRFELTIEPATEQAIKAKAPEINVVSAERIAEELRQLLVHPRRSLGLQLLRRLGLAEPLLPELMPLKESAWEHMLTMLDYFGPNPSFPLALAGVLASAGGAGPQQAARLADECCLRLKLSNNERERTVWLVGRHHLVDDVRTLRICRLKQLLCEPCIHELLALHRADALAADRSVEPVEYCERKLGEWTQDDLNPPPLITGQELIDLGLKPGPKFKEILDTVRDVQLDDLIHTQQEAIAIATRLAK